MESKLLAEKKLLHFYKEFVTLIQHHKEISSTYLSQAFMTMLLGHELGRIRLCHRSVYEILLMLNVSYHTHMNSFIESTPSPFSMIDSNYYNQLLYNDSLFIRELVMLMLLASEIANGKQDTMAFQLLKMKNENYLFAFEQFSKLKDIIRTGWKIRNVENDYLESDATHIVQMLAFASAYLTTFNPNDLNYDKIMEMILIHEVGEILSGDIPECDMLHNSKHDIEAKGVRTTFHKLDSGQYFINLWEEFERRKSPEAKFVYELDKIDPIIKAKYLDEELGRTDLLSDFYDYEEKRSTFYGSKLEAIYKYLKPAMH